MRIGRLGVTLAGAAVALAAQAATSDAFCGFYVSNSGDKLFADATQVVLMRDGTRTVLSMQNDYKGPLADFAMVVPVPVVLKEKDVKTLPKGVFHNTDALGSPRLVEYWEQDPCQPDFYDDVRLARAGAVKATAEMQVDKSDHSVKIEAQFTVGEYQILILSATDSAGLETWLRANKYKIPDGAEPLLRPYVEAGSKFFVAKVDPKKVQQVDGRAALSPLRFHYDAEEFALPIRLGMANSSGKQDLIVNIISSDKRYEVANYKNVFIPTNFDVKGDVRSRFGEFYAALFDKTLEANPGAVVTEYAWTAVPNYHCDPCTDADISNPDLITLGGDVVGGRIAAGNFVLTRLHARYGKEDMKDDLRFKEARPVTGGREQRNASGALEYGATASSANYFQARYAIRHWWTGPVKCEKPQRGRWGGPPDGAQPSTIAASKTAFAPRGKLELARVIGRDLTEIGYKKAAPTGGGAGSFAKPPGGSRAMDLGLGLLGGLVTIGAGLLATRRRRKE
ncbi:MAG: DUF2330 domain-containing protein [Deltaproteobacteria bacterium]|nr:DUF2330 domain-containing protein [Deltaproteobacteria bacterium]